MHTQEVYMQKDGQSRANAWHDNCIQLDLTVVTTSTVRFPIGNLHVLLGKIFLKHLISISLFRDQLVLNPIICQLQKEKMIGI